MNREAQGVVVLLAGAAVLRASMSDLYLRYVRAGLRPYLLLTGVALIVAALAIFYYERKSARAHRPAGGGHGHAHREPRVAWLLLLPVFALVLVVPPALGSYEASRTGTALQLEPSLDFPALPAGDPVTLTVFSYARRAVYDHGRSLGTRRVRITGFVTVGPQGAPYLTRILINCCAADAQPIKVGMAGQVPTGLRPDAWLEIVGRYTPRQVRDDIGGGPIPYIDVSEARFVPAPAEQYENFTAS